ncbi:unnamed protein product [Sphenostylis stenocarpa]|uniref:DUF4704 domain-containing protein n=1 Tax=Sphenostylis stenocarpa TaxID=92480 RepID=A0AA86V8T3_9FABA|nr:unnamed protein product [Sphenostylis stenocarpa]
MGWIGWTITGAGGCGCIVHSIFAEQRSFVHRASYEGVVMLWHPWLLVEDCDLVMVVIGYSHGISHCSHDSMVARVLHLFYRLVVQPSASRAHMFAEEFLACGGAETFLVLLQREAKAGDSNVLDSWSTNPELQKTEIDGGNEMTKGSEEDEGSREK